MTPDDELDPPRIGSELRAQRLGFALRGLAAELVDERRKGCAGKSLICERGSSLSSRRMTKLHPAPSAAD